MCQNIKLKDVRQIDKGCQCVGLYQYITRAQDILRVGHYQSTLLVIITTLMLLQPHCGIMILHPNNYKIYNFFNHSSREFLSSYLIPIYRGLIQPSIIYLHFREILYLRSFLIQGYTQTSVVILMFNICRRHVYSLLFLIRGYAQSPVIMYIFLKSLKSNYQIVI